MSDQDASVELVRYIAKAIVTQPDQIDVVMADDGVIELETAEKDRGRVIGRHGRVAKAMRTILAAGYGDDTGIEILD